MYRTFLVFIQTYWGNITRKSYLLFTFGLPLFVIAMPVVAAGVLALVIQSARPPDDPRPIAIVDQTPNNLFADLDSFGTDPAPLRPFETPASAVSALDAGEVQSYYIFPADYWETGEITADYVAQPNEEVSATFERWVRQQVRKQASDPARLSRYDAGARIAHLDLDGNEAFDDRNFAEWALLFGLIYVSRTIGMFTSGYMYNSIAEESRNRTIEILLTSISSTQFITGKLIGLISVGLTQILIWASVPITLILLTSSAVGFNIITFFQEWEILPLIISFLLGAYLLDQLFAAASGILRVSGGAGTQLFNLISWATSLGLIYSIYFVPRNPTAPLAVATSLFPLTSPIVMLTRIVASEVPPWQVALSQALLWGSVIFIVILLGRLLKRNMVSHPARFILYKWVLGKLGLGRQTEIKGN